MLWDLVKYCSETNVCKAAAEGQPLGSPAWLAADSWISSPFSAPEGNLAGASRLPPLRCDQESRTQTCRGMKKGAQFELE